MADRRPERFWTKPANAGILTAALFTLVMFVGAVLYYERSFSVYRSQIHQELMHLTKAAASLVDGDLHASLTEPSQEGSEPYQRIARPLFKVRDAIPQIRFIYTLRLIDGKIRFVVDATPQGDSDLDGVQDHSYLMDVYEDAPVTAMSALIEGKPMYTPKFYQDKWGLFISGYAPIRASDGSLTGVVALDMSLEDYQHQLKDFRKLMYVSMIIVILLSSLAGLLVQRLITRAVSSEMRYMTVSENVSDAIVVIDETSRVVYANPAVRTMLGYEPSELIGESITRIIPETLRPKHVQAMNRFARSGRKTIPWQGLELPAVSKAGETIPLEVSLSDFNKDGQRFVTGVLRDIGQRKLLEKKAQEAMQMKMDFLAMVTHELRTPLTVMKESIGIVEGEMAGPVNPEQRNFLLMAKRNLDRLARLVNNVLDYQKLEAQKMEMTREPADLRDVCSEVCRNFKLLASEKDIQIHTLWPTDLPKTRIDRDRIVQVLANFMDNAVKYTPRGKEIRVSIEKVDEGLRVAVTDQGAGMKKDEMSRLFGAFNQMSNAREKKVGGTGLGLSISKKIIDLHGGTIGAESAEGAGSTFFFTLPIS